MSKTLINSIPGAAQWEPKLPFDLVVGYEDTTTRNRAIHLYDHLAQQLTDDYDFQCTWWKFDHLSSRTLLAQAADAATEANMIIIALRAGNELPMTARQWLDAWTVRKDGRKSALVALIGGLGQEPRDTTALQKQLQHVARQARMDFFAHEFELAGAGTAPALQEVGPRGESSALVQEEFLHPRVPLPRWGINE